MVADGLGEDAAVSGAGIDLQDDGDGTWTVTVYFPAPPDTRETAALDRARALVGTEMRFEVAALPDRDWVRHSLAALAPVRAGRFLVHGSHDRGTARANDIAIEIDAGLAFGTGHHGTTSACLIAIDRAARNRAIRTALDIGTGSGVLAIAIAKLSRARVMASDIDPVAVSVARENVRRNGVASLVRVVVADGLASRAIRGGAPYELIVANILAGPLVALAPAIRRNLAPGGAVILSGLLKTQAQRVGTIYRALGLRRAGAITIGEWTTLTMGR